MNISRTKRAFDNKQKNIFSNVKKYSLFDSKNKILRKCQTQPLITSFSGVKFGLLLLDIRVICIAAFISYVW